MEIYLVLMLMGFAGLAFMAFGGIGHGHGHGHAGAHGHDVGDVSLHGGHAGGHAVAHAHAGHGHAGHEHGHGGQGHQDHGGADRFTGMLVGLLSPRVFSSVLLGLGATGLLARPYLGEPLLFGAALAGGVALDRLVVSRMWNFLMGFASKPALSLETAVMDTAHAVTSFDRNGQGIVSIELNGQITQVLGTLQPADREAGVRVRAGDRVLIEAVDPARNRCTVSHLGT
jgi:translation initiation factor IF-1